MAIPKLLTKAASKRRSASKSQAAERSKDEPIILILEDDPDQMRLLVNLARREVSRFESRKGYNELQQEKAAQIQIVNVSNIRSLQQAVTVYSHALLAILDCNSPDAKGGKPNDQFVKTKHMITGQHRAVDAVIENLPQTPVTLVSSMGRFNSIVKKYYASTPDVNVTFIAKSDTLELKKHVREHIKSYLQSFADS